MSLLDAPGIRSFPQWRTLTILDSQTLQNAAEILEKQPVKIVLVLDDEGALLGTISDGDIRRGMLKGLALEDSVESVLHATPLVVPEGIDRKAVLQIMESNGVFHLPTLDENGKINGLLVRDMHKVERLLPNTMVIMAGGLGTRLRPHTSQCPKPLLEVAGKPMLTHIFERARGDGFSKFVVTLGYLGHMIKEYFKDGRSLGISIDYVEEDEPLGTAGALGLISPTPTSAVVVTNGDVITDINYQQLLQFHQHQKSQATMAVCLHEWRNPFGVVQITSGEITGFEEKPVARSYINAGVYVLEPSCFQYLDGQERLDMPDLFEALRLNQVRTLAYPMHEPWIDVGRPSDWVKANEEKSPGSVPLIN